MNEEQFIEAINRSMRETEIRLRAMGRKPYYVTREEAEKQVAMLLKAKEEFFAAMDDDFNTALAISTFFTFGKEVNSYQTLIASGKEAVSSKAVNEATALFALLEDVLGIVPAATESAGEDNGLVDGLMELVLELRQQARQNKDWGTADRIRDALQALEVVIEDSPQGTRWKRK